MRKTDLRGFKRALALIFTTLACLYLLAPSLILAQKVAPAQGEKASGPALLTGDFKSAIVVDADTGMIRT